MHGLVNQAIERFARETYGDAFWLDLCRRLSLRVERFEAMLTYRREVTDQLLDGLSGALGKGREEVLEDIGTFLVSAQASGAVRRLLRFSGTDFIDFLYALDDLPARARLAVPELELPQLELRENTAQCFSLAVRADPAGRTGFGTGFGTDFGHVMMGLLRAMADDYGALVLLEYKGASDGEQLIEITLLEAAFSQARAFELGARAP